MTITNASQMEELMVALGNDEVDQYARLFDLPKYPARTLAVLMKREVVSAEVAYTAVYFDKRDADRPSPTIIHANISTISKLLRKKYQVKVHNKASVGWWISEPDKHRIRGIMDHLRTGQDPSTPQNGNPVFIIESDIPIPPILGKSKYPYSDLKVGDSFFAKDRSPESMLANIKGWKRANKSEWKFTVRKLPGGCRIWRVE